ncbi:MAG: hypothetical protein KKA10_07340 [Euryarchaeota archaeon]|nr:hypothetical protein [Euryarchaeota archaeon]MCG2734924.1 phage/plasmid primase, P4 family [Candidatus Methanoperedenaceae archaeon]
MTEISFESIKHFHDLGLILIPMTIKDEKKQPLISYKSFKEKGQDLATLQGLYESYKEIKPLQWAVYCVNGIVGLDFDSPKDYETFFNDIDTLTTRSPSGGYHCFVKSLAPCKSFDHMGFEVKVNELCTILGDGYDLVKDLQPKEFEGAEDFLRKKFPKIKTNKKLKDINVSDVINKYTNKKNEFHGGWAAFCPIHGDENHPHLYVYENTNSWYCYKCKRGGDAAEFIKTLKNVGFKEAKQIIEELLEIELGLNKRECCSQNNIDYHLSDLGNAQRLHNLAGDNIRFCYPYNKWLVWDQRKWNSDNVAQLETYARQTIKTIYEDALNKSDFESKETLLLFALKTEAVKGINGMIELAKSEPGVPILPEAFDNDKMLFNVQNGTIDLRTGCLKPHTKADFITKISPVIYEPGAKCPVWETFLDRIFQSKKDLIGYIQRKCGYILTGETSEEDLDILYGIGGNGKSKLTDAFVYIMGDYHTKANVETIQETKYKNGSAASPDVARLKGARLVTVSEPEKGIKLNESKIKDMTGRDTLSARHLYQESFDFKPEFKLWVYTNYKPIIKGQDRGIWRRIKLIPFDVIIPYEEEDKQLDKKLKAESSGILNWMLAGCLEWQQEGLKVPKEILDATAEYKEEMDYLGDFFKDCCEVEKTAITSLKRLYLTYQAYCEVVGMKPQSQTTFPRSLEERGYKKKKVTKGRFILGMTLSRHIIKKCEELDSQTVNTKNDDMTAMTTFLETFLATRVREKLLENSSLVVIPPQKALPNIETQKPQVVIDMTTSRHTNIVTDFNETLAAKVEKLGKVWQEQNQKSINSLTKTNFVFWFCEQNKEENHTPTAIMSIVERVFKITPEGQKKEITPEQKSESVMTVEVCGVVYEGAVE